MLPIAIRNSCQLRLFIARQWDAIDCFEAEPPLAVIPKIMELVCDDRALITCPTHFLAVYRQAPLELSPRLPRICWKFSYRRDVSIYPVHSLPLLLYCTHLPPIPKSPPEITTIREGNKETKPLSILRLPVIPLRIPYPSVFPMMLQMFYSAHSRQLSYNLVPVRLPVNPTWSLSRVCNEHAVTIANQISDIETIEGYRQKIWMVYRNGCVLRITTGSFWDTLVINWEGTFVALELHKRRKSLELQQEKCLDDQIWSFQIVDGRDKFGLIPKPPSPVLVDAGTQTRVSSPSDSMIE